MSAESTQITNSIRIADKATFAHVYRNDDGDVKVEFRSRLANTLLSTLEIPAVLVPAFAEQFTAAAPVATPIWNLVGSVKNG